MSSPSKWKVLLSGRGDGDGRRECEGEVVKDPKERVKEGLSSKIARVFAGKASERNVRPKQQSLLLDMPYELLDRVMFFVSSILRSF